MEVARVARSLLFGAALAGLVWLFRFAVRWRNHRNRYENLPCPPHSFWWGHLKIMGEAVASLPPDAHPQVALAVIKEKYDLEHVFYLDLWPVSYPLMAIHDPGVAAQICQIHSLPKHSLVKQYLRNVAGIRSIVTEEGRDWKLLRQILSPGFAPQQVMAMVPTMLKHINVFKAKLQHFAGTGESFPMQELASWATIDVIGEAVLGKNFDSQTDPTGIPENFRRTIPWMGSSFNVLKNAVASIFIWWYTSLLDKDIKTSILERHAGHVGDTTIQKTTVDLALKAYRDEKLGAASLDSTKLEPEFVTIAVKNIKTLLLGGHETTATTLSYAFFLLSTHPEALAEVRAEHDSVFGNGDPSSMIESDPKLLNQLVTTTAALKEALRLYPAGSTMRMCLPSSPIQTITYKNRILPLADHALWVNHYGIGRREDLWEDALDYRISRFMPGTDQPKDAFRSFEKGPRNCIGMEMALTEMKIVLVLLLREFEFEAAYPEHSPRAPLEFGSVHYQMVAFGPKPAQLMPMRVRRRKIVI